jgi:hypothetical protein
LQVDLLNTRLAIGEDLRTKLKLLANRCELLLMEVS